MDAVQTADYFSWGIGGRDSRVKRETALSDWRSTVRC